MKASSIHDVLEVVCGENENYAAKKEPKESDERENQNSVLLSRWQRTKLEKTGGSKDD